MEKEILCFFLTGKIVHIIHDQHINSLVKIHKIIYVIMLKCINKLLGKLFAGYIKYQFIRKFGAYFVTDSLCQVRFTQTYTTVYHQRVERGATRFSGNSISC